MGVMSWLTRVGLTALVLVSPGLNSSPADADDATMVLKQMEEAKPAWLPDLDKCPADEIPARATKSGYYEGRCEGALEQCLQSCRDGKAGDCYASALVLQKVKGDSSIPDALFHRACALGVTSGCTNRAAKMDSGPGVACAIRTFTAACDRDDPWACTMIGMHLARGIGIGKDHERAKQVLSKSCRHGEVDEACRAAKALMKEMGD
jgi:TPR repeat protein